MTPDRWARIDQLLDEAMELPMAERLAFLDKACAGDEGLRQEVKSLLDAHEQAEAKFLKSPALEIAAQQLVSQKDRSLIGQVFSHYSVISVLGVGGMGEVYLARDTSLNRKVALKFLPVQFTQDAARIKRFEREAKAASALNHPNIITIYEIGQVSGKHFMAAEYIEGQTLREVIANGRVAEKDVIEIAIQICSALSAAHEAGIIHRDIKPENIMLRRDGYVKVLDFGLVKLTEQERSEGRTNPTTDAEADLAKTNPGAVLGTAKYMSPEQASGKEVDRRSDIFSLGVTLYELLTGLPPFKGDRMAAVLDAIIHHQPVSVTAARPDLDAELDHIVERALEKDRELRYQSADDLRADLKRLQRKLNSLETSRIVEPQTQPEPVKASSKWKFVFGGIAVALVILASVFWWMFFGKSDSTEDWVTAEHRELTEFAGAKTAPAISPDGQFIVYARRFNGQFDLFWQRVDGQSTTNLTPNSPAEDSDPAISPDGKLVAFRSERESSGVYLIGSTGENERLIATDGFNPSWTLDGSEILYSTQRGSSPYHRVGIGGQIWAINWLTGAKRQIPAGPDAVQPRLSPKGLRIAYWGLKNSAQRDIWTIPAAGGEPVAITDDNFDDFCPVWSPDGRYLYFSSNRNGRMSLWRVRIDEATGKTSGAPQPLPIQTQYNQFLTMSRDGKLMAYASKLTRTNVRRVSFDPVEGKITGAPEWATQMTRRASSPDVSPDGQYLTFYSFGDPQMDIYVSKIGSLGAYTQLTNDRFRDRAPRWSPDGKRIAFFSDLSGVFEIWTIRHDGGERQQLTFSKPKEDGYIDPAWAPDGKRLLFTTRGGGQSFIMDSSLPFQSQTLFAFPKLSNGSSYTAYSWSHDGKRIAGTEWLNKDLHGIVVYDLASQQYTRLNNEGDNACWLPNNRHLIYSYKHKIFLLDSQTKTSRLLLAPEGEDSYENATLSHDGRWLYYGVTNNEESVYLISFK